MAFKQPRVPEYREAEGMEAYIRTLVLFLKDFCAETWTANRKQTAALGKEAQRLEGIREEIEGISYPVTSVNGQTGDVTLSAKDVGALQTGAAAADAKKLDGKSLEQIMLLLYPVGAIYMSTDPASPASRFGGTWESIGDRFLIGASGNYPAGNTGGEAAHTLTVTEMPKHMHESIYANGDVKYEFPYGNGSSVTSNLKSYTSAGSGGAYHFKTKYAGESGAHNNMPPWLAVYMWKRVS